MMATNEIEQMFPGSMEAYKKEVAKKAAKAKARLAARQTRVCAVPSNPEPKTALDSGTPLPLIDAHSHLFGASVVVDIDTGKAKSWTDRFQEAAGWYLASLIPGGLLAKFYLNIAARYLMATDLSVPKYMIKELEQFRRGVDEKDEVAAVSLHLDMGYTPLDFGAIPLIDPPDPLMYCTEDAAAASSKTPDSARYYLAGRKYAWGGRNDDILWNQMKVTSTASAYYAGKIWTLVPFDPRRPNAMEFVTKGIEEMGFTGVKLYSRMGWMPYHNIKMFGPQLGPPLDGRLDKLFTYCTGNDIPLLVHTSPTGFPPCLAGFPCDGQVALPLRFYKDSIAASGAQRTRMAGDKLGFPPKLVDPAANPSNGKEFAIAAMTFQTNYCYYNQLANSPYSWEPVLKLDKYKKLRLDLAHSGGTLGVFGKYSLAPDVNNVWVKDASMHPFVLGSKGTNCFEPYLRKGVIAMAVHMMEKKVKSLDKSDSDEEKAIQDGKVEIYKEIPGLFDAKSEWRPWLDTWKSVYPDDWTTKVIELVKTYDNVYADLSYIAGGEEPDFMRILNSLLKSAENGIPDSKSQVRDGWAKALCKDDGAAMAYKNMASTDWSMTLMDNLSPSDFWKRIRKADSITVCGELWNLLSTHNCLRWLNVGRRFNGKGMEMLEKHYQAKWGSEKPPYPVWWEKLKKFYDEGKGDWKVLRGILDE
jgi:hypothetical protein